MKSPAFVILYYILAFIFYLFSLPFLILISFKSKYRRSVPARFFLYKNPPFKKRTYWFHACSLGETRALKPLIEKFEQVNISVITDTGYKEAEKYKNADVRFLPFEIFLPFWVKPCRTLVVMEAELWYMLFFVAKRKCSKTVLLNARISDKSYPRYLKFKRFYKKIFENIDIVLAQSEKDKARLQTLGAKNVEVTGNVKTHFIPEIKTQYVKKKKLLVIASTHKNEEELILQNVMPLENWQVVVVPRHPERFEEVYNIMNGYCDVQKISETLKNGKCELKNDLILCDAMGELTSLYSVAECVILGGSFVDNVGGHNPVEAAYFNVPVISGQYIYNQKELYSCVKNIKITSSGKIKSSLKNLQKTQITNVCDIKKLYDYIK